VPFDPALWATPEPKEVRAKHLQHNVHPYVAARRVWGMLTFCSEFHQRVLCRVCLPQRLSAIVMKFIRALMGVGSALFSPTSRVYHLHVGVRGPVVCDHVRHPAGPLAFHARTFPSLAPVARRMTGSHVGRHGA
jgi:hypothetical protein